MIAKDLVLVTGGSGSTGYACVAYALKAGFHVRTTVRRESAIKEIKSASTSQKYLNDLDVVVVEDMTKDDAFLQALQGVTYVLHVASPMPFKTETLDEEHTIKPAVQGTVGILKSALKVPSVKRVVITSTVGIVMGDREDEVYNEQTIQSIPQGPFTDAGSAYVAGKRLAYRATTEFITQHRPAFKIVNLMPTFILGSWELATSSTVATGSNGFALTNILGHDFPAPLYGTTVHVQDLARVHVEAMTNEKITGHEDFVLNSGGTAGTDWADGLEIAKKHFPEAVEKGILPLGGETVTAKRMIDSSKVENVFGIKLMGFEEQMLSLVGQYVELMEKEQEKKV